MTLEKVVAILCNEPFCLDVDRVMRLTPFQVRTIYLRERDKNGSIIFEEPGEEEILTYEQLFALACKSANVPLWYAKMKRKKPKKNA